MGRFFTSTQILNEEKLHQRKKYRCIQNLKEFTVNILNRGNLNWLRVNIRTLSEC